MPYTPRRIFRMLLSTLGFLGASLANLPPAHAQSAPSPKQSQPLSPLQQEADRFYKQARAAFDSGDYAAAETAFRASREKAGAAHDDLRTAEAVVGLGNCALKLSHPETALADFESALPVFEKRNDARRCLAVSLDITQAYVELSQYDKAFVVAQRSLEKQIALHNDEGIAEGTFRLGSVYGYLGQFDRALDCFVRAEKLFATLKSGIGVGTAILSQGLMYANLHEYDQALKVYEKGYALSSLVSSEMGMAHASIGMGLAYWYQGQHEKAHKCFARARQYYARTDGDATFAAYCDAGLALSSLGLGDYDSALASINQAQNVLNKGQSKRDIGIAWGIRGAVLEARGLLKDSENAYRQMLATYEQLFDQISDPSQISVMQDVMPHPYAHYAHVLAREGRVADALLAIERGRGLGLARQMAQNRADLANRLPSFDAARLALLTLKLNEANEQLRALQSHEVPGDKDGQQRHALSLTHALQQADDADRSLTHFRDGLLARPEYAAYRRLQAGKPVTLAEIEALARRHPDTLYLEYAVVDNKTTLLFTYSQQSGLRFLSLPVSEETLSREVGEWRNALMTQQSDEPARARHLYDLLFAPLEQGLGFGSRGSGDGEKQVSRVGDQVSGKSDSSRHPKPAPRNPSPITHLVVTGDGAVLDIPFAALVDGKGRRLVERYALSTSISLGLLTWAEPQSRPAASLLCAADPTGDQGVILQNPTRGGFNPLINAREEGKAVVKLFPGAVGYFGGAATEKTVRAQMERFGLLHFATHGVSDSKNGMRSCLVLAEGGGDDGFLEAREIATMRLSARLATLSACSTAQGQKSGGEGLLGLAWAFRAAGCPSIVASQWSVDDAATGKLMLAFYKALKQGKAKDTALREAMLRVKGEADYGNPYYWAAFQAMGDTAPLPFLSKPTPKTIKKR